MSISDMLVYKHLRYLRETLVMKLLQYSIYFLCFQCAFGQTTVKVNKLLSRKKRYLLFPKGANFIVSISRKLVLGVLY